MGPVSFLKSRLIKRKNGFADFLIRDYNSFKNGSINPEQPRAAESQKIPLQIKIFRLIACVLGIVIIMLLSMCFANVYLINLTAPGLGHPEKIMIPANSTCIPQKDTMGINYWRFLLQEKNHIQS